MPNYPTVTEMLAIIGVAFAAVVMLTAILGIALDRLAHRPVSAAAQAALEAKPVTVPAQRTPVHHTLTPAH